MASTHMKVIDKKMLKPLAKQLQEEWARWNKGGKDLQTNVDKFFKERPVRKFFEKLAADLKISGEGGTAALLKAESHKAEKELARQMADKYNVLGGGYSNLSDKYTVGKFLGEGGFGKVYMVTEKATGEVWACKEQDKVNMFEEGSQDMVSLEVSVMKRLSGHESVMELHEALEDATKVYFILDLCKGGDVLGSVAKHFQENGSYSEADAAALMRAMLEAVKYCHEKGVLHRDIKPENFLWTEPNGRGTLKLADYGLAEFWQTGDPLVSDRCGTPPYMPPEMWKGKPYSHEPDVWALGVTLSVLLTGLFPFTFTDADTCAVASCKDSITWDNIPWSMISADACDLCHRMLQKDPAKRITIAQCLEHPWIKVGGTAPKSSMTKNIMTGIQKLMQMNDLHKGALRLLARQAIQGEELDSLMTAFRKCDLNGDGKMGKKELRNVFGNVSMELPDEQFDAIFEKLDIDKTGYVSFEEFSVGALHFRAQADEFRMLDAFKLFDRDNDGFISHAEMGDALDTIGMEVSEEIKTIFKEIDVDGDGMVSAMEFCTFWNQYVRTGADNSVDASVAKMGDAKKTRSDLVRELEEEGVLPLDGLKIITTKPGASIYSM
mmetsp:Transcript_27979/g.70342  ORF Transcript_27979/g.70342 Transcript_27979/m.70342 type:complete len:607 (-) Transcript_27979:156-1976(-)